MTVAQSKAKCFVETFRFFGLENGKCIFQAIILSSLSAYCRMSAGSLADFSGNKTWLAGLRLYCWHARKKRQKKKKGNVPFKTQKPAVVQIRMSYMIGNLDFQDEKRCTCMDEYPFLIFPDDQVV